MFLLLLNSFINLGKKYLILVLILEEVNLYTLYINVQLNYLRFHKFIFLYPHLISVDLHNLLNRYFKILNYFTSHQSLVAALSGPFKSEAAASTAGPFSCLSKSKNGIRRIIESAGTSGLSE